MPKRDWTQHDAAIPFRDDRLIRLNGASPTGRRPHLLVEPERKPLYVLLAANDNAERRDAAA
jgi:hypothetical protein